MRELLPQPLYLGLTESSCCLCLPCAPTQDTGISCYVTLGLPTQGQGRAAAPTRPPQGAPGSVHATGVSSHQAKNNSPQQPEPDPLETGSWVGNHRRAATGCLGNGPRTQ